MRNKKLLSLMIVLVLILVGCSEDPTKTAQSELTLPDNVVFDGVSLSEARIASSLVSGESVAIFRNQDGDLIATSKSEDTVEVFSIDVFNRQAKLDFVLTGNDDNLQFADGNKMIIGQFVDGVWVSKTNKVATDLCEGLYHLYLACCVYHQCSCDNWDYYLTINGCTMAIVVDP